MSHKIKIEISDNTYNQLKKLWEEGRIKSPLLYPFLTVEEFIDNILSTFAKSSEQFKGMESKMTDILKMFGGSPEDFDFSKIFEKEPATNSDDKNEKQNEKKMKS